MDGGSSVRDRSCFYTSSSSWTTRGRRTLFFCLAKGLFYEADNDGGVGRPRISFWGTEQFTFLRSSKFFKIFFLIF